MERMGAHTVTTPHPQSRASLLALKKNLMDESLSRARVYRTMHERIQHDRHFVSLTIRANGGCCPCSPRES